MERQEKKYKMVISYNGAKFSGWQVQPGQRTVQGVIKAQLESLLRDEILVKGASRTDSGVHALGQVAHFTSFRHIPVEKLFYALNNRLPDDINIRSIEEVRDNFDSRKDALGKHYQYRVHVGSEKPIFSYQQVYYFPKPIDLERMNKASCHFIGEKDYTSFASNAKRPDEDKVRNVTQINIWKKDSVIYFDVYGKSFLYKMVRGICGTLLEIGRGRDLNIASIFAAKDRCEGGRNLPGRGLYLMEVFY